MRRLALLLSLVLVVPLLVLGQEAPVPEIAYESVSNLLKLPADLYLGEAAGVAVNSKGDIFVFTRSGHTRLFEFDSSGKFMREIGQDLYGFSFAHVVRVDKNDNIWCVDEGANMVIEFQPRGARHHAVRPQAGSGRRRRSASSGFAPVSAPAAGLCYLPGAAV